MKYCSSQVTGIFLFAGIFMLLLVGSGCNDCKDSDPITLLAGRNLKAYGVFKPGTYWIYQNDSTLLLDSIAVSNYMYDTVPVQIPCGKNNSNMKISSYLENFYTYLTSYTFNKNYLLKVEINQPVLFSLVDQAADTLFIDAVCADTSFCKIIDTLRIIRITPPINYDHYEYMNVYERIDSSSSVEDGNLVYYYSAAHYGIVKKQIQHPDHTIDSWSLLRFHIVQ
ncbi:MAG: hypothetical protein H0W62_02360 [Chitinophagales bacterium]|nr:hypothetical protein [Chitinophagales bacterium]